MKTSDLVTGTVRQSEAGKTWEEKISNAMISVEVPTHSTFRVRATGASTVTIDGILAMTMSTGEVALFNSGDGNPDSGKNTVTVTIGVAAAYVQVAREIKRLSNVVNPFNHLT